MAQLRNVIPALVMAALPLAACGGGDDGVTAPEGPHYGYVAAEVLVPTDNTTAREYGLDLNGDKTVDNQLGMVLGTLQGQMIDVKGAITQAVVQGDIILLVDFQSKSFTSTSGAGLSVKLGATPMPAPCTDPTMIATCGQHLKGTGTFTISSSSPSDAAINGKIAGGVFTGGPGTVTLQISLGSGVVTLDLIGARAKATSITDASMEVIVAGALTKDDLDTKVIPAIATQVEPILVRDCTMRTPPVAGCGCTGTGKTVMGLFDTNKDCQVTAPEIAANSLITALLSPDVKVDGKDALSLGIKVKLAKASFPGVGM